MEERRPESHCPLIGLGLHLVRFIHSIREFDHLERGNVSSLRRRRRRRIEQSKKCARRREQTWMGRRRCRPHPSPVRFRVNLGQANCQHIFVYQGLVGDVDSVVALLALLYEV